MRTRLMSVKARKSKIDVCQGVEGVEGVSPDVFDDQYTDTEQVVCFLQFRCVIQTSEFRSSYCRFGSVSVSTTHW